jgi:Flavin containing amine oxidoreductase
LQVERELRRNSGAREKTPAGRDRDRAGGGRAGRGPGACRGRSESRNPGDPPPHRGPDLHAPAQGLAASRALARPVAGTLFFAGEATDADQSGTAAGAIAIGQRAAEELLKT